MASCHWRSEPGMHFISIVPITTEVLVHFISDYILTLHFEHFFPDSKGK